MQAFHVEPDARSPLASKWPLILLGILGLDVISSREHNSFLGNRSRYAIKYRKKSCPEN